MAIGQETIRLTADPAPDWAPRLSPDGSTMAFYSSRTGDRELWVMPASGGAARQLTHSPGADTAVSWSPDGRTLAFRSERTGNSEIWTVQADGSGLRQMTDHAARDYCATLFAGRAVAGVLVDPRRHPGGVASAGCRGAPVRVSGLAGVAPTWSPDGARLYLSPATGPPGLWSVSVEHGREQVVAELGGRRGSLGLGALATDATHLYFTWRSDVGDIWVMDVDPS